jgi:hyperosmotically inducible protein
MSGCGNEQIRASANGTIRSTFKSGSFMKANVVVTCVLLSAMLGCGVASADEDATSTGSHAAAYVKDSAITVDIKTKLAAEHLASLGRIHVDTDTNGVVWLSGSAKSQRAVDKAVAIANHADGVRAVHSDIAVTNDD